MMSIRSLAWLGASSAALTLSSDPLYAPAKGSTFDLRMSAKYELALDDWSVEFRGRETPPAVLPKLEVSTNHEYSAEFSDEILAAKAGKPLELRRTFGRWRGAEHRAVSMNGQAMPGEPDRAGDAKLEGCVARFEDAKSRVTEKGEGNAQRLSQIPIDLELARLVETATDDHWTVGAAQFSPLDFGFAEVDLEWDRPAGEEHAPREQLAKNLSGEWTLTRGETRVENGVAVLTIQVHGRFESHSERKTTLEHVPITSGAATEACALTLECEGQLKWDVSAHFAVSATISGEQHAIFTTTRVVESGDEDTYRQVMNFSGPVRFEFAAEPAKHGAR